MPYFTLKIRGYDRQEGKETRQKDFEFVLEAANEKHAKSIIDRLLAHGHSLQGLHNGIADDNCEDIGDVDKLEEHDEDRVDATIMYFTDDSSEDVCDEYPDDLELVEGSIRECEMDVFHQAEVNACHCDRCDGFSVRHCPDCERAGEDCPTCDGRGSIPRSVV